MEQIHVGGGRAEPPGSERRELALAVLLVAICAALATVSLLCLL